ncbi:MAG: leucyl/phenylalanyl-tRNA--protein transferase [Amylibacter sp.]|nr:leucyl/phenylalanyl-tRNA--protein transferase [Amylibacter sp.]
MPSSSNLTPEQLLKGYAIGVFPMANSAQDDEVYWVEPEMRGIIPIDGFHTSRSLKRALDKADYEITFNTQFESVVRACANRKETWINATIFELYQKLHKMGSAHSIEVNRKNILIGGVYGISLGTAFFGESMFSTETNGSKIALAHLVKHLKQRGFKLFDTQFQNNHLKTLGCVEIPQSHYLQLLKSALIHKVTF